MILDAGSSGTRLHIYRWKDPAKALKSASTDDLTRLPKLKTDKEWTKKIRPGVSTFGDEPADVGPAHLQSLIDHALDVIPKDKVQDTPIFLMATAGMRLLPSTQQTALTREICLYLRTHTKFSLPDCDLHIQVIEGETEGLYGWIATNYLLGGFDRPTEHHHGKGHHTYGFLDMGGASAQIAFAPNATEAEKHANDLKLLRMRTINGASVEYRVFSATWLGFGANQARQRYLKSLQESYPARKELPDPCMPNGLKTTLTGQRLEESDSDSDGDEITLLGTGAFDECLHKTYPLLGKDAPCQDHPCLLNGQHVPAIDFDVNHFIGVSEYWHTTHGVFGVKGDKAYDFVTYQKKVLDFCSQNWKAIEAQARKRKDKDKDKDAKNAQEACFKASWLINMLHEGIGIPRAAIDPSSGLGINSTKGIYQEHGYLAPFQAVDKLDGMEVSWTLGKMVLYAAGQIRPQSGGDSLPIGFGANVVGIPEDFQPAGSSWKPLDHVKGGGDDEDDWSDTAENLLDKAKFRSTSGFFVFVLVVLFMAYLFRKRERRMRMLGRLNGFLRRSKRPGSPRKGGRGLSGFTNKLFGRPSVTYERVLEDGEADRFELGDVDYSDDSDCSEGSRLGRSSGLATPMVNVERLDPMSSASAVDRGGLVERTDSRERLVSTLHSSSSDRRSRAGSPTRLKSPLLSLPED